MKIDFVTGGLTALKLKGFPPNEGLLTQKKHKLYHLNQKSTTLSKASSAFLWIKLA